MAIKKYFATKDNTITNAFKDNLLTRGTKANMGASDILETFVIHGQTSASLNTVTPSSTNAANAEQTRFIIQFPVSSIQSDITSSLLPGDTSSIKYMLNVYNAAHGDSTPLSYSLDVCMLNEPWNEGRGLDMDNYADLGASNWLSASSGVLWTTTGSAIRNDANSKASFYFDTGMEDLTLDISQMVYKWLDSIPNYGLLVRMQPSVVSGSDSMYTKKFFARTSEFFHKRPTVEAIWNSSRKDNRGNFYVSSSMATPADNLNTLYLYNNIRGELKNIPGLDNNTLSVEIHTGSSVPVDLPLQVQDKTLGSSLFAKAGLLIENNAAVTGIYTASFACSSSNPVLFDVWSTGSAASKIEFFTGSFEPLTFDTSTNLYENAYNTNITNLKPEYRQGEEPTFRVFTRSQFWEPTIYTKATTFIKPTIINNVYYRIYRVIDNLDVVTYQTGSTNKNGTLLSYDVSGSYFKFDTSCLEQGYSYGVKLAYLLNNKYLEQPYDFIFRITQEEK